jgi:hypothetical protein
MMAEILKFPDKHLNIPRRYRITLYTDYEIELVLFTLNTYPEADKRYVVDDLTTLDPIFVKKSLDFALSSSIISDVAKKSISKILDNMQEIPPFEE